MTIDEVIDYNKEIASFAKLKFDHETEGMCNDAVEMLQELKQFRTEKDHLEACRRQLDLDLLYYGRIINKWKSIENTVRIGDKWYVAEQPKLKTIHSKTGEVVIGGFKEFDIGKTSTMQGESEG